MLVTVTDTANIPRPPSVKKIMKYKKARAPSELPAADAGLLIEEWNADTLNIDPALCGLSGSPTRVKKIENVTRQGRAFKQVPPTDEGLTLLVQELMQEYAFD